MVNETIKKHERRHKQVIAWIGTAAAVCIFSLTLNISETFAETMHDIPVIKHIADVLTIRSYDFEKENIQGVVDMPQVDIKDADLEDYINSTIEEKVQLVLTEAEVRADEYKTAYLETGGTEEGWAEKNMQVTVDYDIYLQNDDYLSFRVFTHETLAAVYSQNLYFNLDLQAQRTLSLADLLGEDYVVTITSVVKEDIESNPDIYFDNVKTDDWQAREDVSFYLNGDGKVVVVFEKYELAPGAMGRLEYEIN